MRKRSKKERKKEGWKEGKKRERKRERKRKGKSSVILLASIFTPLPSSSSSLHALFNFLTLFLFPRSSLALLKKRGL